MTTGQDPSELAQCAGDHSARAVSSRADIQPDGFETHAFDVTQSQDLGVLWIELCHGLLEVSLELVRHRELSADRPAAALIRTGSTRDLCRKTAVQVSEAILSRQTNRRV